MNTGHCSLSLEIPVPCLVRRSNGLPVDPGALREPPPPLRTALNKILSTSNSELLLLGLNELFGGAAQYAISGSTALAIHHEVLANNPARQPEDLDVVVSASAMDRLSDIDHKGLASLGFECPEGNTESIFWFAHDKQPLKVDVIVAGKSFAGRGLGSSELIGDIQVMNLNTLTKNLNRRRADDPLNNRVIGDLAGAYDLMRSLDQSH